ncbi:MAG: M20/M25/M40 family metallo-hydrolase [Gammaproteobacteria bacterium]|nr:MAG: M20/M25/M40 family metallo-hydrolase [Gammaproteobacteria bacterium]
MQFLASDLLQGRETGTAGYELAAGYVAAQLAQLGVQPAGDNGTYYQSLSLVGYRNASEGRLVLHGAGAPPVRLEFGVDYVPRPNPLAARLQRSAPVVFAGFGVVAPGADWDDYGAIDVQGRIVAVLAGAPAVLPGEERAFYAAIETKRRTAAARGAIGLILLQTPAEEGRHPFARTVRDWQGWQMAGREPDGTLYLPDADSAPLAYLSTVGAAQLFAGAPVPLEQVWRDADGGHPGAFALPVTLAAELATELKPVQAANVVGRIEGGDPARRAEVVVLSAHLDHLGMQEGGTGDVIYNGALDNAAGVATNLEVARSFVSGAPPRRTVVFLFVAAEESGMAGSLAFARHPTVPGPLVANVNLDMPMLTYAFRDVVAFGAERSSLGPLVRRAARRLGVAVSPDPVPEQGLFTRSDHFSFVRQGVPAVFLMTGFAGDGARSIGAFIAGHYHQPSDDLSLPIDYAAGARFARLNQEIARAIANSGRRPAWVAGDFFGERFGRMPDAPGIKPRTTPATRERRPAR